MRKTLKLMAMLLCMATVATLSSCSKDYEDLIVGTWQWTQDSSDGVNWEVAYFAGVTVTFYADGTYVILGDICHYSVNGSIITFDDDAAEIVSLTKEELIIKNNPSSYNKFRRM